MIWTPHRDAHIQGGQLTLDGASDWIERPASASRDFASGDSTIDAIVIITRNSPLNNDAAREGSIFACYPTGAATTIRCF
ncbi:hypothetical protein [Lysobacter claricitrinus]|uniref:hypothetical protein n=1 Tax=Lysobacter claricitrinus TaxID=3367728 RepID=UPI0037DA95F0